MDRISNFELVDIVVFYGSEFFCLCFVFVFFLEFFGVDEDYCCFKGVVVFVDEFVK